MMCRDTAPTTKSPGRHGERGHPLTPSLFILSSLSAEAVCHPQSLLDTKKTEVLQFCSLSNPSVLLSPLSYMSIFYWTTTCSMSLKSKQTKNKTNTKKSKHVSGCSFQQVSGHLQVSLYICCPPAWTTLHLTFPKASS